MNMNIMDMHIMNMHTMDGGSGKMTAETGRRRGGCMACMGQGGRS